MLLLSLGIFGALAVGDAGATDWREVLVLRFLGRWILGVWGIAAAHERDLAHSPARARYAPSLLSSFSIGAAIAATAAAYLLPTHGWRVLFFVCGTGRDQYGLRLVACA